MGQARLVGIVNGQLFADFYCAIRLEMVVTCEKCHMIEHVFSPDASYNRLDSERGIRFGDMVPWLGLPAGWTVVDRKPYCPNHVVTIT